jgi:integrase
MHGEIQLLREWTKSDKPRMIPILPELSDTLKDWVNRSDSTWVFSHKTPEKPYTSFQGFFGNIRQSADPEALRFHDLRHTVALWWVQKGGKLLLLKDILGHACLQMVKRYAHLDGGPAYRVIEEMYGHTLGHTGKN